MSSQNLPSMQEARQLRTSGMDANQMYEEVRAIAGESAATPLSRGPQRSSHEASEVRRAPPPHPASAHRHALRAPPSAPCHPATPCQPCTAGDATLPLAPAPPSAARSAAQGEVSPIPSHLLPAGGGIARRDSDGAGMQAPCVSWLGVGVGLG